MVIQAALFLTPLQQTWPSPKQRRQRPWPSEEGSLELQPPHLLKYTVPSIHRHKARENN